MKKVRARSLNRASRVSFLPAVRPDVWGRGNDEEFFGEEANPLKRITF
jgi:hypothetical protein